MVCASPPLRASANRPPVACSSHCSGSNSWRDSESALGSVRARGRITSGGNATGMVRARTWSPRTGTARDGRGWAAARCSSLASGCARAYLNVFKKKLHLLLIITIGIVWFLKSRQRNVGQLDVAGVDGVRRVSHLDGAVGVGPNLAPPAGPRFIGNAVVVVVAEGFAVLGVFAATAYVRVLVKGEVVG